MEVSKVVACSKLVSENHYDNTSFNILHHWSNFTQNENLHLKLSSLKETEDVWIEKLKKFIFKTQPQMSITN